MKTPRSPTPPPAKCCNCNELINPDAKPVESDTHGEVDQECSAGFPGATRCVSSRVWVTPTVAVQFDVDYYSGPEAVIVTDPDRPTSLGDGRRSGLHDQDGLRATIGDMEWMKGLIIYRGPLGS